MSEKPVAWQRRLKFPDTPGAFSGWLQCSEKEAASHFERSPHHEYRPLYSQSPAEARALAIAEAARAIDAYGDSLLEVSMQHASIADECADIVRALSSPPSVSEEWVEQRANEGVGYPEGPAYEYGVSYRAVRATLAALGVEVK